MDVTSTMFISVPLLIGEGKKNHDANHWLVDLKFCTHKNSFRETQSNYSLLCDGKGYQMPASEKLLRL